MLRFLLRITTLLVFVDFLDEAAGVQFVALPEVQAELGIDYRTAVLAAFTVPGVIALVAEPPLLLWADRHPRRRRALVVGGLLAMALGLALTAISTGPLAFAAAMGLVFVGSGVGVNLSQATLMEAEPGRQEQWMARWVLMGTLGDLAAPALVAAVAWLSWGWRQALGCVAVAIAVHALLLATRPFPTLLRATQKEEEPPLRKVLGEALRNKHLLLWLAGVSLCGLLDEVFVAFGAAWLEQRHGATLGERGVVFTIGTLGGVLGLLWLDRALARGADPLRWLGAMGIATTIALLAWLAAPTLWMSGVALVALEVCAAQLYPLAHAQAFRALPDRAALVSAIGGLFGPVDLLMPLLIGVVADRWGLLTALVLLGAQPLVLAALALREARPRAV